MKDLTLVRRAIGPRTALAPLVASLAVFSACTVVQQGAADGGAADAGSTADSGGGTGDAGGSDGGSTTTDGGGDATPPPDGSMGNDSGSDGGPVTPDWSCLNDEVWSTSGNTSTFTMTFADIATHAPNAGVQAFLCGSGTPVAGCVAANPNGDVDAQGTADASGTVVLNVTFSNADGYVGYVHVVDPSNKMLDDVVEVNFVQDLHLKIDTFTQADVTAMQGAAGNIDLTSHSLVYGKVLDCSYQLATGATVTQNSTDPNAKVVYYAGGAASATAKATDASGAYLVTNAPFAVFGVGWSNAAGTMVGGLSPDLKVGAVTTILYHPTD